MKTTIAIALALAAMLGTAGGMPASWVRRNGLTDQQIDDIFQARENAQIRLDKGTWMRIRYRMHRFDNITNWLHEAIGGRIDERLLQLQDAHDGLLASNMVAQAAVRDLQLAADRWKQSAEAWMADYSSATNRSSAFEEWLLEKTNSGTALQKTVYKLVYTQYTNVVSKIEEGRNARADD